MKLKETATKALSLGIGMAIGLVLVAKVCYEMSHDTCYTDYKQIYSIRTIYTQNGEEMEYGQISGAIAPGFKDHIPGVDIATRYTFIFNSDRFTDEEKNTIKGSLILADTCFFDVFDTEILAGNPKEALSLPGCAMVSESFAKKLGGISEAIGKTIANEESPQFMITVKGIFKDFPYHSSIRHDVLLSMESMNKTSTENWIGNDRYRGFVRLAEGTDPDMLAPSIRLMQEKNYPPEIVKMAAESGNDIRYFLASFSGEHIKSTRMKNIIVILSVVSALLRL